MRRVVFLLGFAITGCALDVELGRYRDHALPDAGADDAGLVDAGLVDAGTVDAGSVDAGSVDAGSVDAGSVDAGSVDAGSVDAGSVDAGAFDAGSLDGGDDGGVDGGLVDGGPAALSLQLLGPLVIQVGDTGTWSTLVFNDGGQAAAGVTVAVRFPPGLTFLSGTGCVDAGARDVACSLGTVLPASASTGSASMAVDAGQGWHDVTGQLGATVPQTIPLSVTGVGTVVIPIVSSRWMDISFCVGTDGGITSYSMCTPASLAYGRIQLLIDGGINVSPDGGPAPYVGVWGQSPHQRNLGFRFLTNPGLMRGSSYSGASVNATCFQGVFDNPAGVAFSGAWEGCLN